MKLRCATRARHTLRSILPMLLALAPVAVRADETRLEMLAPSVVALPTPQTMYFPVVRSGDFGFDVVLMYHTINQSAIAGTDYTSASGPETLMASEPGIFLPVTVSGLSPAGPNLAFSVALDSAIGIGPSPEFAPPQTLTNAQGADAQAALAADFNGDGKPDIAFTYPAGLVAVRINETLPGAMSPNFTPEQSFAAAAIPNCLLAGDVNGDGRPDLIVCDQQNNDIAVLLNTTPPGAAIASFSAPSAFASGTAPIAATLVDVDNDGRLDIAVANSLDNTVSVLMNATASGAATPAFASPSPFAVGTYPVSVSASDINNDGRRDLVVANLNSYTVSILLNASVAGSGTPQFADQQLLNPVGYPRYVTTADIDNDGRADVVVAIYSYPGVVSVYRNTTMPGSAIATFGPEVHFDTLGYPDAVAAVDLDADGKVDLVAANSASETMSVLRNATVPGSQLPYFEAQKAHSAGAFQGSVVAADLNGDGRADLIAARTSGHAVSLLLNATEPDTAVVAMEPEASFPSPTLLGLQELAIADLNGDGRPDVIVADVIGDYPALHILRNDTTPGARVPKFAAQQAFDLGPNIRSLAVADINRDGRPDLVAANASESGASVLLNMTAPGADVFTFAPVMSFGDCIKALTAAVADFDLDGRPDIAVMCQTQNLDYTVSILFNDTPAGSAQATFAAPQTFPGGGLSYLAATMDVNGDGRPDLISIGNLYAEVYINNTVPGSGSASFAPAVIFMVNDYPTGVTVTDLNSDGVPDLAFSDFRGTTVLINTTPAGAATPSFAPAMTVSSLDPHGIAAADFDGDGQPDLVIGGYLNAVVSLLPNTTPPGGTVPSFAPALSFTTSDEVYAVAASDLTSDGSVDLIAAKSGVGTTSVFVSSTRHVSLQTASATGTITREIVFANGFE